MTAPAAACCMFPRVSFECTNPPRSDTKFPLTPHPSSVNGDEYLEKMIISID